MPGPSDPTSSVAPEPLPRRYLLTEACVRPDYLARMEFHDARAVSLWRTDLQPEFERYAPYLSEVSADCRFHAWFAEHCDGLPFTLIQSTLDLPALAAHLRRFGKFVDGPRRLFMRLGDASAFHLYVGAIAGDAKQVKALFNEGGISSLYFHVPDLSLSQSVQALFEQKAGKGQQLDGYLVRQDIARPELV